nr:hypothetical protein Itr_chr02CG09090 [Ipomoea trifida]
MLAMFLAGSDPTRVQVQFHPFELNVVMLNAQQSELTGPYILGSDAAIVLVVDVLHMFNSNVNSYGSLNQTPP